MKPRPAAGQSRRGISEPAPCGGREAPPPPTRADANPAPLRASYSGSDASSPCLSGDFGSRPASGPVRGVVRPRCPHLFKNLWKSPRLPLDKQRPTTGAVRESGERFPALRDPG